MIRGNFVHPHVDGTKVLREFHGDTTLCDLINDCFSVQEDPHVQLWAVLMPDLALTPHKVETLSLMEALEEEESEERSNDAEELACTLQSEMNSNGGADMMGTPTLK